MIRAFSVAITAGGLFELYAQWMGYRGIRRYQQITQQLANESSRTAVNTAGVGAQDEVLVQQQQAALNQHIMAMVALFVMGCGIPAIIRVLTDVASSSAAGGDGGGGDPSLILILVTVALFNLFQNAYGNSLSLSSKGTGMSSSSSIQQPTGEDDEAITEQTPLSRQCCTW